MQPSFLKPALWPACPDEFNRDGIALLLVKIPEATQREDARQLARDILNSCCLIKDAKISASPYGPQIEGMHISLSYAGVWILIGLSQKMALGVDIVQIQDIAEIKSLSALYLPARLNIIDTTVFASEWAKMEACCKALKLPLAEIDREREKRYASCQLIECEQIEGYRIAVAALP